MTKRSKILKASLHSRTIRGWRSTGPCTMRLGYSSDGQFRSCESFKMVYHQEKYMVFSSGFITIYHQFTIWLWLTKPWKITMLLIGKPSISMGHLYHSYVRLPEGTWFIISFPFFKLPFGEKQTHQISHLSPKMNWWYHVYGDFSVIFGMFITYFILWISPIYWPWMVYP